MKRACIAGDRSRVAAANPACRRAVVGWLAGLLATGCALIPEPERVAKPETPVAVEQPAPAPSEAPPVPEPATPPPEPRRASIVPNPTALFFDDQDTRKTLLLRNEGNRAGEFSLRLPKDVLPSGGSVEFRPASGTIPAGAAVTVVVEVQRDTSNCDRVLKLAVLETARGTSSIGVNYTNTGSPDFRVARPAAGGSAAGPGSRVIDFGKEDGKTMALSVTNQGCASGDLTIVKNGLHEDSLAVPEGPMTVDAGATRIVTLERPDESFFLGERSVTLLIRQDGATVDNVEVRWAGLSLLP